MTAVFALKNKRLGVGSAQAPGLLTRWLARRPEASLRRYGRWLGRLIAALDRPHRGIVCRNLQLAYPQWPAEQVRHCCRRVFENLGITLLEILQLRGLTAEEIGARIRIDGREHIASGMACPTGVVIVSAHLGNWEMAPLFFAAAYGPIDLVARNVRPQPLDRWMTRFRTRFGNRIINKQGGLAQMTRSLRAGNALGLLVDQGTKRSEGVRVRFFDHDVSATPAAVLLAMRCRCPVYAAFTVREESGGFRLIVFPEIRLERSRDLRADLVANTQKVLGIIEEMVRAYPEQWFWLNKRWKHYHPELYPEHQVRRDRRRRVKFKRLAAAGVTARTPRKG